MEIPHVSCLEFWGVEISCISLRSLNHAAVTKIPPSQAPLSCLSCVSVLGSQGSWLSVEPHGPRQVRQPPSETLLVALPGVDELGVWSLWHQPASPQARKVASASLAHASLVRAGPLIPRGGWIPGISVLPLSRRSREPALGGVAEQGERACAQDMASEQCRRPGVSGGAAPSSRCLP